jgi:hypothetical protein
MNLSSFRRESNSVGAGPAGARFQPESRSQVRHGAAFTVRVTFKPELLGRGPAVKLPSPSRHPAVSGAGPGAVTVTTHRATRTAAVTVADLAVTQGLGGTCVTRRR